MENNSSDNLDHLHNIRERNARTFLNMQIEFIQKLNARSDSNLLVLLFCCLSSDCREHFPFLYENITSGTQEEVLRVMKVCVWAEEMEFIEKADIACCVIFLFFALLPDRDVNLQKV